MCSVYHVCMYVCMHACMPYMSVPPVQILVTTNLEKIRMSLTKFLYTLESECESQPKLRTTGQRIDVFRY